MLGLPETTAFRQQITAGARLERAPFVIADAVAKIFDHVTHRRNSLVGRLIRLASAWFILVLCVTGIGLTTYFYQTVLRRFDVGVGLTAYSLFADTDISPDGRINPPVLSDRRTTRYHSGLYWQISEISPAQVMISRESTTSYSAGAWRMGLPKAVLARAEQEVGKTLFYTRRSPSGGHMRVAVIFSRIDGRAFAFLAGEDIAPMVDEARMFAFITGTWLFVMALGSLVAIYLQVRIGLRPLFDLTEELADTQSGAQQRLTKIYPAEIQPVATQINAFLDYSRDIVERQRMHISNLAHALKTPLSVLIASAGNSPGALNETVRRQADIMHRQVDHHLRRARAAAHSLATAERTLVEPVIDELAVTLEQVFHHKGVIIDWRTPEDLAFRGERSDFQEIAGNLLENACTWCVHKVRIEARLDEDGQMLDLSIEDDRPGFSDESLSDVIRLGMRLDENDPSKDMGLSLVDELAHAYGGTLTFSRGEWGGLRAQVRLPSASGEA